MQINRVSYNTPNFQARIKVNKANCKDLLESCAPFSKGTGMVTTAASSYSASAATAVDQLSVMPISDTRSIPEIILKHTNLADEQNIKNTINNYESLIDASAYSSIATESVSGIVFNTKGADVLEEAAEKIKRKNIPS